MNQEYIILDIEASSTNPNKALPRLIGWWSSITKEWGWTTDPQIFQEILQLHKFVVGWNQEDYDNTVLKRFGVSFKGQIQIDLMKIIHGKGFGNDLGRKGIIMVRGQRLGDILHGKSLAEAAEVFDVTRKVGDFDYSLFKGEFAELSKENQELAIDYLYHDIMATKEIYDQIEDFFADIKDGGVELPPAFFESVQAYTGQELEGPYRAFMTPDDVERKFYLTGSVASMVYAIICNITGMARDYGDGLHIRYGGGFVALPSQHSYKGTVYCFDYNSLYPHIMILANLYGIACTYQADTDEEDMVRFSNLTPNHPSAWKGQGISETDGYYRIDYLSPVSSLLKELYGIRQKFKKQGDSKEYTIKIIINTIYGLLGNPVFKSVSNIMAASDCTRLGRQWVQAARQSFKDAGYDVLYTDTDSVYVGDPFNDFSRAQRVVDAHIQEILDSVPFSADTFQMGLDDEIKLMAFVPDGKGSFKKKNYLYLAKGKSGTFDKVQLKGLPVKKSNATKLSKRIFEDKIKPAIVQEQKFQFPRRQFEAWMSEYLEREPELIATFKKIKAPAEYDSKTSLNYQLATDPAFGEGSHYVLKLVQPHPKAGGKNKNYLKVEDVRSVGLHLIDLHTVWNELSPFIKSEEKSLSAFF